MGNQIKEFLDVYHHHQNEKAVMKFIVPFIVIAFLIVTGLVATYLLKGNQLLREKVEVITAALEQKNADYIALNERYDKLYVSYENQREKLTDTLLALQSIRKDRDKFQKGYNDLLVSSKQQNIKIKELAEELETSKNLTDDLSERVVVLEEELTTLSDEKQLLDENYLTQDILVKKLEEANYRVNDTNKLLQKELTFYTFLLTPTGSKKPKSIFIDLSTDLREEESALSKQSINSERLNVSPSAQRETQKKTIALYFALISAFIASLIAGGVLKYRKQLVTI